MKDVTFQPKLIAKRKTKSKVNSPKMRARDLIDPVFSGRNNMLYPKDDILSERMNPLSS